MTSFISTLLISSFLLFTFSCKTKTENNSLSNSGTDKNLVASNGKTHNELIKAEKKKQSEDDLPFRGIDSSKKIDKIAFGSGLNPNKEQNIWKTVLSEGPDLFIVTGNQISNLDASEKPLTPVIVKEAFKKLYKNNDYRAAREKIPFLTTWSQSEINTNEKIDDTTKENFRTEFLKFWPSIKRSLSKNQKDIKYAVHFGDKKTFVQILFLDTKWDQSEFKKYIPTESKMTEATPLINTAQNITTQTSPTSNDITQALPINKVEATASSVTPVNSVTIEKTNSPWMPDSENTKHFLNQEQWAWLEKELKHPSFIKIIVTSIPLLSEKLSNDSWALFPKEKEKFLNLIKKSKIKNLIILAGANKTNSSLSGWSQTTIGSTRITEMISANLNLSSQISNPITNEDGFENSNYGIMNIDWENKKISFDLKGIDKNSLTKAEINF